MSNVDDRINLAVDWLVRNIRTDTTGAAGWGWVPDVPPNPQDTAEVVCALSEVGREIPDKAQVVRLLRQDSLAEDTRGPRVFRAPIDVAWRLRALLSLGHGPADRSVSACAAALLAEQDRETGGWRMSSRSGAISVTATTEALRALVGVASSNGTPNAAAEAVARGTNFVVSALLDNDVRFRPLYASSQAAIVLSLPEITAFRGKRIERARELAWNNILHTIRHDGARVEEEIVRRGDVTDAWRHVSLHWAVTALAYAGGRVVFDPIFRKALKDLLDLQDTVPTLTTRGGFRTSSEGFVTTYATTQAVEALAQLRQTLNERVNPAKVFDLICRDEGASRGDGPLELLTHKIDTPTADGVGITMLCGISDYITAHACWLDEYPVIGPAGAVFVVPSQRHIYAHPVANLEVVQATTVLAQVAVLDYTQRPWRRAIHLHLGRKDRGRRAGVGRTAYSAFTGTRHR